MFRGLSKERVKQRSGAGNRVVFSQDDPTVTVQFLQDPTKFLGYEVHSFQEDGRWQYVPCAGADECPLCDSESDSVRKTSFRFVCNVVNFKDGKVQVLEGPKTLAAAIWYRYARKKTSFLKRVYDITKFPTQPVTYNFELAEEDTVATAGKKALDLEDYLLQQMKAYYGDDLAISPASLEADDDEEEDEEDFDEDDDDDEEEEDEDEDDEEDDDEDEEDDEDEDDDEEEEDEPPRRKPVKKAAAKKVPATKKAAAKRTPAKRTARRK